MRLNLRRITPKHGRMRESTCELRRSCWRVQHVHVAGRRAEGVCLSTAGLRQSPGDRAKTHIGRRAPNRAFPDRVRRASEHRMRASDRDPGPYPTWYRRKNDHVVDQSGPTYCRRAGLVGVLPAPAALVVQTPPSRGAGPARHSPPSSAPRSRPYTSLALPLTIPARTSTEGPRTQGTYRQSAVWVRGASRLR